MDKFFDRLGDLVRSLMSEHPSRAARRPGGVSSGDPDPVVREAWEELDAYLRGEEKPEPERQRRLDPEMEALRQDYANLEVPVGAPFEEVRKSYRRLLAAYHPDRNAGDAERLRLATEITKKINVSFRRIEELEEKRRGK